jgi:melanoma-associated antigen p97
LQDTARGIAPLNENLQTYSNFLGNAMTYIMGIRECPVNRMTLCVTSEVEKDKCVKMKVGKAVVGVQRTKGAFLYPVD